MHRQIFLISALAGILTLAGCSKPQAADNTEQVRENAAAATSAIKRDSKAIVEGVKEGWSRDKAGQVELNSATRAQLRNLPGMTDPTAARIIKGRPYSEPHDLVAKGILSEDEYAKLAEKVTVKPRAAR